jgi:hypothetical protein
VLTDDLIGRCGDRAAGYDRDNRFFFEDFEAVQIIVGNFFLPGLAELVNGVRSMVA